VTINLVPPIGDKTGKWKGVYHEGRISVSIYIAIWQLEITGPACTVIPQTQPKAKTAVYYSEFVSVRFNENKKFLKHFDSTQM